ncbi:hypothetical protein GQ55_2G366400 [Panicum hallii var. hallii]|uniref:Uncharacterized protein n=1 Tax=Panicum hallii var. hallii TaxID=1504633 RepID=A0A2T7EWA0_9POAL|nr:hypothetical protein GQ55_2G366400 [Panicum hallii var. hallii]
MLSHEPATALSATAPSTRPAIPLPNPTPPSTALAAPVHGTACHPHALSRRIRRCRSLWASFTPTAISLLRGAAHRHLRRRLPVLRFMHQRCLSWWLSDIGPGTR